MKYLDYEKQTAKEFNDILKEGMKTGVILSRKEDIKFMIELAYNLNYYLTYFISASQVYGKKESCDF
jgi:hypothetical protein